MFANFTNFFKKIKKIQEGRVNKESAKERLHLVLLQDRANVSADFLDMMKQEIIEVIKKYIDIDEKEIDVKLTNKQNSDGTTGAPALYANIPIVGIKDETRKMSNKLNLEKLGDKKSKNKNNKEKKDKNNSENSKEDNKINSKESKDTKTKESNIKEQTSESKKNDVKEKSTENKENEVKENSAKNKENNVKEKSEKNKESNAKENSVESKKKNW